MEHDNTQIAIYWSNLGWYADQSFVTLEQALSFARSRGYECAFHQNGECIGAWSFLSGFRDFRLYP